MTYDVFISYSRKDTAIADRICAAFDVAGISYFIDRQGIAGGMEFPKILAPAIKESEVFLLLASENAYQSPFTTREILFAFNKKRGEKMLSYIIDGSVLPDDVEFVFSSTNWRSMHEHPIDPVLVDDVLRLLDRKRNEYAPQDNIRRKVESLCACVAAGEITLEVAHDHPFANDLSEKDLEYFAEVGMTALQNKEYEKALFYLYLVAYKGHVGAQFELSRMYAEGKGVPQDHRKAEGWFERAAKQGGYIDAHETWF